MSCPGAAVPCKGLYQDSSQTQEPVLGTECWQSLLAAGPISAAPTTLPIYLAMPGLWGLSPQVGEAATKTAVLSHTDQGACPWAGLIPCRLIVSPHQGASLTSYSVLSGVSGRARHPRPDTIPAMSDTSVGLPGPSPHRIHLSSSKELSLFQALGIQSIPCPWEFPSWLSGNKPN